MILNLLIKVAPFSRQFTEQVSTYDLISSRTPSVVTSAVAVKLISTVALMCGLPSLDQTLAVVKGLYRQNHT